MKKTSSVLSIFLALLMIFSVTVSAAASLTLDSVKIGDTDLSAATTIRSNDVIDLTFSADVTSDEAILATNLMKIKVRNAAGDAVNGPTVSVVGKKKLSVSLNGIEKANYTLTIGKKFQDVNGNTLAADVSIPFTVNKGDGTGTGGGNGESPLELVSVKAGDKDLAGAELESSGTITITFSRGMDENQAANFEKIGIYDKDGKKVANVSFSDFQKPDPNSKGSYTVLTYKNLATGEYTLKLGKDLKANNGNTLEKAETITFTVKDKDDEKVNFIRSILDKIADLFKKIIDFFKGLLNK